MTFSAEDGDVHLVGPGPDIGGRKDVMTSVTFAAGRGVWSVPGKSSSMDSFHEPLFGHIMTDSTADFFQPFGMGEFLHFGVHMATDTV